MKDKLTVNGNPALRSRPVVRSTVGALFWAWTSLGVDSSSYRESLHLHTDILWQAAAHARDDSHCDNGLLAVLFSLYLVAR
jgi:hypothetical protein